MPLSDKEKKRKEAAKKVKELIKRVNEKHKTIYRITEKPNIMDRRLYTIRELPED